jgi:tetratricopeptide (TPR) repeat protein
MKTARALIAVSVFAATLVCVRADHQVGTQLGTVQFHVSGTKAAQEQVVRGVKLVHHMMYPEADRAFAAAAEADPKCALAYWGRAMTIIHPLWPDSPSQADLQRGAALIKQGLAVPPATARERAYLETLARYFEPGASLDYPARLKVGDQAWSDLADQYPDDLDALAWSALYHLAPARFVAKDKSHRIQLEAASRLQKVLAKLPDHPGGQHYKIHAYDFPLLADRALEICDTYGSIAPDVPHALHMPTHIFTRRGLWDKSIDYNRRSSEAARKLGEASDGLNGHYAHALDYMVYAHLQRGQYREADAIRRQILALRGPYSAMQSGAMAFAFAAIPARYALERHDWTAAAKLSLHQPASFSWGKQYLHCDSITRFARAIGAARSGQLDVARTEIAALEKLHEDLARVNRISYWAAQAQTQLLAARAWVQFAEKKTDDAIASMRRAAEIEATVDKEAVTPGEVLPAGDLLGDLLAAAGRHGEALAAYESVLTASPNRLNTLFGAAVAAENAGKTKQAREFYQSVLTVAAEGDSDLQHTKRARTYLEKSGGGRAD